MQSVPRLEKRIIWISLALVLVLLALSALAINLFHVGLPTCLTDIKPFQKGELITHSPTHYELHYVARMWKFEPEDVTVPAGSTVDIYLSAADVITETGGTNNNTITILGDGNDIVHLTGGFTAGPTPLAADPTHFSIYTATVASQTVNVIVSTAIDVTHITHT